MKKVDEYLEHRRCLGYAARTLKMDANHLRSLARYVAIHSPSLAGPLTVDMALRWAAFPTGTTRGYHAHRLSTVRVFSRYLAVFDPRTEIPPHRLLGPTNRRVPPYIYTRREIAILIRASLNEKPSRNFKPYSTTRNATIIGLLACTGMRIGEVLSLEDHDVDLTQNVITVHQSKNLPTRLVPISGSASRHLQHYRAIRDRYFEGSGNSDIFIRSQSGGRSDHDVIMRMFRRVRKHIGPWNAARRAPRLHDLRHTFACNHLLRAYRKKRNIDNAIHDLSVYLGHVDVAKTYWYLSAVPALLRLCSKRSEAFGLRLRRRKGGRR